ncbi:MAG: hypothetical protein ACKVHP_07625 [Verrucomicrobiales bacterium]
MRCKPANLPEKLQGDVTNLDMGLPFHVSEVAWPEGVTPVLGGDVVIAIVAEMKALISEAAAVDGPAAAAAEV